MCHVSVNTGEDWKAEDAQLIVYPCSLIIHPVHFYIDIESFQHQKARKFSHAIHKMHAYKIHRNRDYLF